MERWEYSDGSAHHHVGRHPLARASCSAFLFVDFDHPLQFRVECVVVAVRSRLEVLGAKGFCVAWEYYAHIELPNIRGHGVADLVHILEDDGRALSKRGRLWIVSIIIDRNICFDLGGNLGSDIPLFEVLKGCGRGFC